MEKPSYLDKELSSSSGKAPILLPTDMLTAYSEWIVLVSYSRMSFLPYGSLCVFFLWKTLDFPWKI
jgi:hypothetical protein